MVYAKAIPFDILLKICILTAGIFFLAHNVWKVQINAERRCFDMAKILII